jgi:hypothetical protein
MGLVRLLFVSASVAAAAALWWGLTERTPAVEAVRPASRDERPDSERARSSALAKASAAAESTRRSSATELWTEARTGGMELVVQVVRAESGVPVADADVAWCGQGLDRDAAFESWLARGEIEEHLQSLGKRTDALGRARIPACALPVLVCAAAPGLWGYATLNGGSGPLVVALAPDASIQVKVVDASGTPCTGVAVALRHRLALSYDDRTWARTDAPDGTCELRHAGFLLGSRAATNARSFVAVQGLFDPPIERAVTLADASRPVELVLRPTGSCEVEVVDELGTPFDAQIEAELRFADVPGERGARLRSRTSAGLVFERVELGRRLAVAVRREDSGAAETAEGPGPQRAGERVRLRVRCKRALVVLHGQIVDSTGAPLAGATARARLESNAAPAADGSWTIRTDELGLFSVDAAPQSLAADELTLAVFGLDESGARRSVARRRVSSGLARGTHELGIFTLADTPIAASGCVVDGADQPLAGIAVLATAVDADFAAGPRGEWLDSSVTDQAGRFAIRGEVSAARVSLQASGEGRTAPAVTVANGARDARIVLAAGGKIAGEVLLDPSVGKSAILIEVARAPALDRAALAPEPRSMELDASGFFIAGDLAPGTYALRVIDAATGLELASVDGLEVRAGASMRDPRLDPLDLRSKFRWIALEPIDELGQPVRDARAFGRPSDDATARWSFARRDGARLRLLCDGRGVDVSISAAGFRRQELARVQDNQQVVMAPAARLRIALEAGLRAPSAPSQLELRLIPLAMSYAAGPVESNASIFDERGELARSSAVAGEMGVELSLVVRDPDSDPRIARLESVAPPILRIAESSDEQRFVIRFDPTELEETLRRLRAER